MELGGYHDESTTIRVCFADSSIEIIGNTVVKGRILLKIVEYEKANDKYAIIAEWNDRTFTIIYKPYASLMWNITGKELDKEAMVYYF